MPAFALPSVAPSQVPSHPPNVLPSLVLGGRGMTGRAGATAGGSGKEEVAGEEKVLVKACLVTWPGPRMGPGSSHVISVVCWDTMPTSALRARWPTRRNPRRGRGGQQGGASSESTANGYGAVNLRRPSSSLWERLRRRAGLRRPERWLSPPSFLIISFMRGRFFPCKKGMFSTSRMRHASCMRLPSHAHTKRWLSPPDFVWNFPIAIYAIHSMRYMH